MFQVTNNLLNLEYSFFHSDADCIVKFIMIFKALNVPMQRSVSLG